MKQSSKRLFSMVLSLIFLIAALLVFFDLVQPTYGDLQTKKGQEGSNKKFLDEAQRIVGQAKTLLNQYQNESQGQDNLALAMPSGPNVAGALAQVYGIAQNNNIVVQNISISPATIQAQSQAQAASGAPLLASQIVKPIGSLSFQLTTSGSYESLKNFLSQLETNIRIFDVTGLSVQAAAANVTSIKGAPVTPDFFTFNITVVTYYQLP